MHSGKCVGTRYGDMPTVVTGLVQAGARGLQSQAAENGKIAVEGRYRCLNRFSCLVSEVKFLGFWFTSQQHLGTCLASL